MKTTHKIYFKDSTNMSAVPASSVHLVVTSPPYPMIEMWDGMFKRRSRKIGICGQGPSDFPEFATFLVECGIDSMSLIPDTAVKTRLAVAAKEKELGMTPD